MVIPRLWSSWLAAFCISMSTSCADSPSEYCDDWAAETCQALATCCETGSVFDSVACERQLSRDCREQARVGVAGITDGIEWDGDAADECLFQLSACTDFWPTPPDTFAHRKACANMVTGFEPPGSMCGSDETCARAGDYPTCYFGVPPTSGFGLCVAVVVDTEHCSFSSSNELHVCADGKFCDLLAMNDTGVVSALTDVRGFIAPCRDRIAPGASCIDPRNHTDVLPCVDGYYCASIASGEGTCLKRKPEGALCDSGADECERDLFCPPAGSIPGQTCQRARSPGLYCASASRCGDGRCDADENDVTCVEDCAVMGSCLECACHRSLADNGCGEVCSMQTNGMTTPDFCDGHLALGTCAACIESMCGFDLSSCVW
ncbi:Hypothetical protein A7982_02952 [Minicystis rosea]|nr:Hypothetical protein A7982_02952 [Minicystis rosea]